MTGEYGMLATLLLVVTLDVYMIQSIYTPNCLITHVICILVIVH